MFRQYSKLLQFVDTPEGVDNGEQKPTGAAASTETKVDEPETEEIETPKVKTYSQEQVDEMIKKRLERKDKEFQAQKDEAEKFKKMNADQKRDYELDKIKAAKEAAEAKLARFELIGEARKQLSEEGISATDDDLELIVTSDAESTNNNVKQLIDFKNRIAKQTTEQLTDDHPPITGRTKNNLKDLDQSKFDEMSYEEKAGLFNTNPDLFKKFTGGN